MKTNNYEVYNRITELLSLLNHSEMEPTVRLISHSMESSETQVRKDLQRLNNFGIAIGNYLDDDDPLEEIDEDADNELSNLLDDDPLLLIFEIPGAEPDTTHILFFEKEIEASLFQKNSDEVYKTKDSPLYVSRETKDNKKLIEAAAEKGKWVRFNYLGIDAPVSLEPNLYHDATDDRWYCLHFTSEGEIRPCRLDRIRGSISVIDKPADAFVPDEKILERLDYIWGADFNNEEEKTDVKILINANTSNLLEKIRSDTSRRKNIDEKLKPRVGDDPPLPSVWPKDGDYYIYEDEIIGLKSFRRWLMAFGSSVKVLEPRDLAKEIYESSIRRLQNYEEGNCFHEREQKDN